MCISHSQRKILEEQIASGVYHRNFFDFIKSSVFDNMFRDSFHRFVNSGSWSSVAIDDSGKQDRRILVVMAAGTSKANFSSLSTKSFPEERMSVRRSFTFSNFESPFKNDEFFHLLHTEDGYQSFQEFTQKHLCNENLELWSAIEKLQQLSMKRDVDRIRLLARQIFDSFISDDATVVQVGGISEVSRRELSEQIEENPTPEMYLGIQNLCYITMRSDIFVKYKQSDLWKLLQAQRLGSSSRVRKMATRMGKFFYRRPKNTTTIIPVRENTVMHPSG